MTKNSLKPTPTSTSASFWIESEFESEFCIQFLLHLRQLLFEVLVVMVKLSILLGRNRARVTAQVMYSIFRSKRREVDCPTGYPMSNWLHA